MPKSLYEISQIPDLYNNVHESIYRSYHTLIKVLEMVERGDSKETIKEVATMLELNLTKINPF